MAKESAKTGTIIRLSEPLNGSNELSLDFSRINGYTLIKAGKDARKEEPTLVMLQFSQYYLAAIASAAAGVKIDSRTPINVFLSMPIDEYKIWEKVINDEIKRENKALENITKK